MRHWFETDAAFKTRTAQEAANKETEENRAKIIKNKLHMDPSAYALVTQDREKRAALVKEAEAKANAAAKAKYEQELNVSETRVAQLRTKHKNGFAFNIDTNYEQLGKKPVLAEHLTRAPRTEKTQNQIRENYRAWLPSFKSRREAALHRDSGMRYARQHNEYIASQEAAAKRAAWPAKAFAQMVHDRHARPLKTDEINKGFKQPSQRSASFWKEVNAAVRTKHPNMKGAKSAVHVDPVSEAPALKR